MAPKHRRSEIAPPPTSPGAAPYADEYWPRAVGYGQAAGGHAAARHSWPEPQDWQDWGPPPELPSDHPSAPVPRVRGYDDSYRRLHAVPDGATTSYRRRDIGPAGSQEDQDYAAGIRAAAQREAAAITQRATSEAAAIREAAHREAAELLARLDAMSGELRRVAAYIAEGLAAPVVPTTAPPRPVTRPARPDARPAEPAKPRTAPDSKPQKRPRQLQAMRIAKYSTAALLSFAVISGVAEAGLHGYKFFVFREGGVGQTPGQETDQQFLNREAAAAHQAAAPKGRHAKQSHAAHQGTK